MHFMRITKLSKIFDEFCNQFKVVSKRPYNFIQKIYLPGCTHKPKFYLCMGNKEIDYIIFNVFCLEK